jgi:hypothetical protein
MHGPFGHENVEPVNREGANNKKPWCTQKESLNSGHGLVPAELHFDAVDVEDTFLRE